MFYNMPTIVSNIRKGDSSGLNGITMWEEFRVVKIQVYLSVKYESCFISDNCMSLTTIDRIETDAGQSGL
jgi:hypothetical protein